MTKPESKKQRIIGLGISLIILFIGLFSIAGTQDLYQKNEETIFLTHEGQKKYEDFRSTFSVRPIAIAVSPIENNQLCKTNCHQFPLEPLPGSQGKDIAYILLPKEEVSGQQFKDKLKKLKKKFNNLKMAGVPFTNILLDEYSESIKKTLFPALFVGLFILLLIFFRSLKQAFIVFFPGLLGSGLSLGTTKLLFGHSNLITSIIPLLLFVIQLSLVLHIHETAKNLKDLGTALLEKKEPIFLMVITTVIGFGALFFSNLEAIGDFGILAAGLILLCTIMTLLWLHGINLFLNNPWGNQWNEDINDRASDILRKASNPWSYKKIISFSVFSLLVGAYTLPKIPILTDATLYFPKESGIKEQMDLINREYLGSPILEITLPLKESSGQKLFEELKVIHNLENQIKTESKLNIISSNQLVTLANKKYAGTEGLPENRLSYFGLRSRVPIPLIEGYPIEENYRITILGENTNVDEYEKVIERIERVFSKESIKNVKFNGLYYHLMKAQKEMITILFKSFLISLILISTLSLFYFRSLKVFFIFMIVNLLPVFASFPLLWVLGLSFNIATVMTYSISLGLIVDSSFHIIHALRKETLPKDFYQLTVVKPVLIGSLFLAFCFFFFYLNEFLPIRQFGICLGVLILWGLLMDLKVLPTLFKGPKAKKN